MINNNNNNKVCAVYKVYVVIVTDAVCGTGTYIPGYSSPRVACRRADRTVRGCSGGVGKTALSGPCVLEPRNVWERPRLLQKTGETISCFIWGIRMSLVNFL